mmetsp:Transcript_48529/g.155234  ORF Transcript_48529/g.155234 Transcript_48529/m.155234 type:complete len:106 (-) Transcript_48529:188-505(-)
MNPLNVMRAVALQGDFVVMKLDIDMNEVEKLLVFQILQSLDLQGLIDEFIWEHHVHRHPLEKAWKGSTGPHESPPSDPYRSATLEDSYQLFLALRKTGIRAHSWV